MSKKKELLKNISIFAIGSISTKLLQFLLIPFYTRILTDSQYGTIDILQAIATLLIPIISLAIYEAIFRYTMEKNIDQKKVLSAGLITAVITNFIFIIIGSIIYRITKYEYITILVLYVVTHILRTILSQFVRAIGKLKVYTIDNVMNVLITLLGNIVFLTRFSLGVEGYLLGYVVANIVSVIYLCIKSNIVKYLDLKNIDKQLMKKMLKFSLPLIPNAICWWIISFLDRAMITSVFGTSANGVYSIANKVPAIITIIVGIFFDAWQISANKEFENEKVKDYYSEMFEKLFDFVFIISATIIPFSQIIIKIISGEQFWGAWVYMPILLISTSVFSLSQYLGSIYTASKKTKMAFFTNIVAALTNFVLNLILIKYIGVIGAAIATLISYVVLYIYRVVDTKKIIHIKYNTPKIIIVFLLIIIEAVLYIIKINYSYYIIAILILMIYCLSRKSIIEGIILVKSFIKKEKK